VAGHPETWRRVTSRSFSAGRLGQLRREQARIQTDAYAFLDIDNPVCAWATYRGILVCAPDTPGFVSVWTASLIRTSNSGSFSFESKIEAVRVAQFPHRVSRLRGMFCLLDGKDASRATSWDHAGNTHFQPEYLAELSLSEAGSRRDRLDANWITFAARNTADSSTDHSWIAKYWSGEPYPNQTPIWETLVDGRIVVLGTDIRQRAYAKIKSEFPDSLTFLEIARQAAWVGSDLGSISAFLRFEGQDLILDYGMNMLDAKNPEVLEKLTALRESGHPINYSDMKLHVEQESFGRVPDLRPYGFRVNAAAYGPEAPDTLA
jgi:hypothetical protein